MRTVISEMTHLNRRQKDHFLMMNSFLEFLNQQTDDFILKGGAAVCLGYGVPRFTTGLDFVCRRNGPPIKTYVREFCKEHGLNYKFSDHDGTAQCCYIHYGGYTQPLEITASYRFPCIPEDSVINKNGVRMYNLPSIVGSKLMSYLERNTLRDLFDVVALTNLHYDSLSAGTAQRLREAFEYKGAHQLQRLSDTGDYDSCIDVHTLATDFAACLKKLDILTDQDVEVLSEYVSI